MQLLRDNLTLWTSDMQGDDQGKKHFYGLRNAAVCLKNLVEGKNLPAVVDFSRKKLCRGL